MPKVSGHGRGKKTELVMPRDMDFERLQRLAAAYISDWVESLPESDRPPVRGATAGGPVLSPREMLRHVETGSP
jgi:hypothetical protein